GRRLDRHGAARIVRRVTRWAGITKPAGPHTLRHAFITALGFGPAGSRPVPAVSAGRAWRRCLPHSRHGSANEGRREFTCGFAGVGRVGAVPAGAAKWLAPPS